MRIYRWPLSGPEPPITVRRIAIGPKRFTPSPWPKGVIWGPVGDVWLRRDCRRSDRKPSSWPRHMAWTRYSCEDMGHYHWYNGDKVKPWTVLHGRSDWGYAVDMDAVRHKRKRRDRLRGSSRWRA